LQRKVGKVFRTTNAEHTPHRSSNLNVRTKKSKTSYENYIGGFEVQQSLEQECKRLIVLSVPQKIITFHADFCTPMSSIVKTRT